MIPPTPLHDPRFLLPRYGGGSFADIPELLRSLLIGGEQPPALRPPGWEQLGRPYDHVIALFIDALGWRFIERFQDHPFLRRLRDAGSLTPLTSQFPSTTSAHVTTLYSGLPVGRHGIYEWFIYEPTVDAVITPLLFSFAGDTQRETLRAVGVEPADLLPPPALIADLTAAGVQVFVLQPRAFAFSAYSRHIAQGATLRATHTLAQALVDVTQLAHARRGPQLSFVYFGDVDSVGHHYGPDTAEMTAEIDACLTTLESWLRRDWDGRSGRDGRGRTLLVLFADHGMGPINPATTIYLNRSAVFPRLAPLLQTDRRGRFIAPAGGPRDYFLHVRPQGLEEAQALLAGLLDGRAVVLPTETLIAAGLFGPLPVSDRLRARVGNLAVLPYAGEGVFWYEQGRFEQGFHGHHGGLTADEMAIPLGLLPIA